MRRIERQRGDTIIEVMLAFVIFSLLAVGAISIMNQGALLAQRALEVTLVRGQIDAQADALRNIHDFANTEGADDADEDTIEGKSYKDWSVIAKKPPTGKADTSTSQFTLQDSTECPAIPSDAFIINARTGELHPSNPVVADTPFSEVVYDESHPDSIEKASGIWIESKRREDSYVDFHIRACWQAAGGGPAIIGTIVRMYDAIE